MPSPDLTKPSPAELPRPVDIGISRDQTPQHPWVDNEPSRQRQGDRPARDKGNR
jgi:hypothetical protein